MSIYDGVVTINEEDVQVILGVDDDKIRLSAGGMEIGEWSADDCSIEPMGEGVFTITAEDETLTFVPNDPLTFSAAFNGGKTPEKAVEDTVEETSTSEMVPPSDRGQVPDPKPLTMIMFYVLAAVTGILGLWALISIVF